MRLPIFMAALVGTLVAATPAAAQDARIVMRRPLQASTASAPPVAQTCGSPGQPACQTDCRFVSAYWQVGNWTGGACGQGATVTRTVQCIAVSSSGDRIAQPDAFCLQDAASFSANCNPELPN